MSFWNSPLGELSGTPQDAYVRTFKQIPDNTLALAKIDSFLNKEFNGTKYLQIDWLITDGDFTGQHVFQKLHVFDDDNKKRHRSLNMLMLIYKMFGLKPASTNPPEDKELGAFKGKEAGIKVQETAPNDDGKQYNWVSEVHPVEGFKCETGHTVVVHHPVDSALNRYAHTRAPDLEQDLPF